MSSRSCLFVLIMQIRKWKLTFTKTIVLDELLVDSSYWKDERLFNGMDFSMTK